MWGHDPLRVVAPALLLGAITCGLVIWQPVRGTSGSGRLAATTHEQGALAGDGADVRDASFCFASDTTGLELLWSDGRAMDYADISAAYG